jgi:hypothetical protein
VGVFAFIHDPSVASAEVPTELRPGTKGQNFDFGPAFGVGFGNGGPLGGVWLDYLYHFRGNQEGPAIGALGVFSAWPGRIGGTAAFMFQWDFALVPSKNLGLYLGPHAALGFTGGRWNKNHNYAALYGMGGATLKLSVNDFWSFWVRPVNMELYAGNFPGDNLRGGFGASLGAGITF